MVTHEPFTRDELDLMQSNLKEMKEREVIPAHIVSRWERALAEIDWLDSVILGDACEGEHCGALLCRCDWEDILLRRRGLK